MEARLLGPVQIRHGNQLIHVGGTRQRTVLAALLLAHSAGVPNARLERFLWGGAPPESAHAQIQTYIYKLRKALPLGATVERQGSGYALIIDPHRLDVAEFENRAALARQALADGRAAEAAAELRAALALWRGPALADVTEYMRQAEQPRLEELRIAALEDRIDADLVLGTENELVPDLTGLVAEHPLRDRLRGQLMLALHRDGRQAEALGVYRAGRRILLEETGLEPGERLQRIHDAILTDRPGLPAEPIVIEPASAPLTPARTEPADAGRPAQLPPLCLELVGRDGEIGDILSRFRAGPTPDRPGAGPLYVITGMAGAGKTVLATHVAQRLRESYPDGQLYADLHGLDTHPANAADVLARFLQALGIDSGSASPGMEERLSLYRTRVADRRILIVLDDASSAAQVRPLLPAGAGCAVIITCRTRMSGLESAGVVDLGVFESRHAVDLIERLAGPARIAAEPQAAGRIAQLCGYLPLALGVAGARLAARPHWPLSRLAHRLAGEQRRLHELTHDGMDVSASLLRGSQHLPASALRAWRLLARLDVPRFAPWVVAALLAVPPETAEELVEMLVDARLLEVVPAGRGPHPYHRFHSLVRAVARENAAWQEPPANQRAALGNAFAAWLALAREAERRLTGEGTRTPNGARRLLDHPAIDEMLADPLAWHSREEPVLLAVAAQARAEKRRTLSAELAKVIGRLSRIAHRRTPSTAMYHNPRS